MIDIIETIKTSTSKADVCKKLKWPNNGRSCKKIDQIISQNELNVDFKKIIRKRKYELIKKNCPVCGDEFETQKAHKKEKITCSYSCSNTFHRTGEDNPNYKDGDGKSPNSSYRRICFKHHKKECVVCGENVIVDVHHYDGDHDNNKPENLIPLCPTHHQYWHSKFRNLIKEKIDKYVKWFKSKMVIVV